MLLTPVQVDVEIFDSLLDSVESKSCTYDFLFHTLFDSRRFSHTKVYYNYSNARKIIGKILCNIAIKMRYNTNKSNFETILSRYIQ